jgi:hypothetical protein
MIATSGTTGMIGVGVDTRVDKAKGTGEKVETDGMGETDETVEMDETGGMEDRRMVPLQDPEGHLPDRERRMGTSTQTAHLSTLPPQPLPHPSLPHQETSPCRQVSSSAFQSKMNRLSFCLRNRGFLLSTF